MMKPEQPVWIDYTNHRGERRWRHIEPRKVYWGATEWHPEPQWLLHAWDRDKLCDRDYAFAGIHMWRTQATDLAEGPIAPATVDDRHFQEKVRDWAVACFGQQIANDKVERNHRFLEEAVELVQALGCTASEAHQLVDYVFGRPVGRPTQEVGGVMVTLAALCAAQGINMHIAAANELFGIWDRIDRIRAKQAAKPKRSPLPMEAP